MEFFVRNKKNIFMKSMSFVLLICFTLLVASCSKGQTEGVNNQQPQESTGSNQEETPNSSTSEVLASEVIPSSQDQGYKTYKNYRFGYSIDYPGDFIRSVTAGNGDGIELTSPDKKANLTVFGGNNSEENIKEFYDSDIANIKGELGYTVLKSSWYAITWKGNGKINYEKMFVGLGSHNGFIISYPEDQKPQYDDIVTKLEASFKAGDTSKGW